MYPHCVTDEPVFMVLSTITTMYPTDIWSNVSGDKYRYLTSSLNVYSPYSICTALIPLVISSFKVHSPYPTSNIFIQCAQPLSN